MDFKMQYETVKDHYLEPYELGKEISSFYLRRDPDSYMMSTLLIFHPGRIIVAGDLSPGRYGVISCGGYGIDWFAMKLDAQYLAEKFLSECYESDRAEREAIEYYKWMAEDAWEWRDRDKLHEAKKLKKLIKVEGDWMFDSPHSVHECLERNNLQSLLYDGIPFGYGYPTGDYCWLAAIQKRFSEVYPEWLETEQGKLFLDKDRPSKDKVIADLWFALTERDTCSDCSGRGWNYVDVDGEAEHDPCHCVEIMTGILDEHNDAITQAIHSDLVESGVDMDKFQKECREIYQQLVYEGEV